MVTSDRVKDWLLRPDAVVWWIASLWDGCSRQCREGLSLVSTAAQPKCVARPATWHLLPLAVCSRGGGGLTYAFLPSAMRPFLTALALAPSPPWPWATFSAKERSVPLPVAGANRHSPSHGRTARPTRPPHPTAQPQLLIRPPLAGRRPTPTGSASMTATPARPALRPPPAGSVRPAPSSTPWTSSTPRTGRISVTRGSFRTGKAARTRWSGASPCCRAEPRQRSAPRTYRTLTRSRTAGADSYYKTLAQNLVSAGFGSSYIRLGWEFNGNWMGWSICNQDGSGLTSWASDFVPAFQNIVTSMRSVSGANFKFIWNPLDSSNVSCPGASLENFYPGDNYVDMVALDAYDGIGEATSSDAARWSDLLNGVNAGDWHRGDARPHQRAGIPGLRAELARRVRQGARQASRPARVGTRLHQRRRRRRRRRRTS